MLPKGAILKIECKKPSYLIYVINMKFYNLGGLFPPYLFIETRYGKTKAIFGISGLELVYINLHKKKIYKKKKSRKRTFYSRCFLNNSADKKSFFSRTFSRLISLLILLYLSFILIVKVSDIAYTLLKCYIITSFCTYS